MTNKVMVFGTFDGIHEGHKKFFEEAKTYGDHLIAVVAQDTIVEQLKGKRPLRDMAARFADLQELDGVDEVAMGDMEQSSYEVVLKHRPDVIAFGYDQKSFKEDLDANYSKFDWKPKVMVLNAFEPDKYHSSILRDQ